MVASRIASANISPPPPADHAIRTGGAETSTTARPPTAAEPMVPTWNIPATPHWTLTPKDITAEIRHRFRMVSASCQLCSRPTASKIVAIAA